MPFAVQVISSCADIAPGRVCDLFLAYSLATGICLNDEMDWNDLPLGAGSDLIDFAKSEFYLKCYLGGSYGQIARAWLAYRAAKFA